MTTEAEAERVRRPPATRSAEGCDHPDFAVMADVERITKTEGGPVAGYSIELAIECLPCGTAFEFLGLPMGLSPRQPTGSFDATIMTAPCRPVGSPPDFGLDLIGFGVEVFVATDITGPAGRHRRPAPPADDQQE